MKSNEARGRRRLRDNFRLMEPDELTPEERWERVAELLALMCLTPEAEGSDRPPEAKPRLPA